MATPVVGALTGRQYFQIFPVDVPPYDVSPEIPDPQVRRSQYNSIRAADSGSEGFTENYKSK